MSYPATFAGPQPTALWIEQNPLLEQFQFGMESDGVHGIKVGPGYWNDLVYVAHRPINTYLADDLVINNTATMQAVDLTVSIPPNSNTVKYRVEVDIFSVNTAKAFKFDFDGFTATIDNFIGGWKALLEDNIWNTSVSAVADDFVSPGTFDASDTSIIHYAFRGSLEITNAGNGGTFGVRAAQTSANASDTTLKQGSSIVLTRLN